MKTKYTKEVLKEASSNCFSIAQTIRNLGLKPSGGNHRHISKLIRYYNIDVSHHTGQAHSKGKNKNNYLPIQKVVEKTSLSKEEIFCKNSKASGSTLRRSYKRINQDLKCSRCHIYEWNDKPLTMHIDHINGINGDNRLSNLRYLCPNCHQQTKTWGNKKRE